MGDNNIYALFRYYGDGRMVTKDFLCLKYGTPSASLEGLLEVGYLKEVYYLGQMIGFSYDKPYLDAIEDLMDNSSPSIKTIETIDIRMPSCCSCCAVSKDFSDMSSFRDKLKSLIADPKVGTLLKDDDLNAFFELLYNACTSKENYTEFAYHLPERYL